MKVTTLATALADWPDHAERGLLGDWGFAVLVDAGGQRALFDTGAKPEVVLGNADALGIDLGEVGHVVLSHHHSDHTGGLVAMRQELQRRRPGAPNLGTAHVAKGFFKDRGAGLDPADDMRLVKAAYEASGGRFQVHNEPAQVIPGVWVTGPVPRLARNKENNWTGNDDIPEDQALVLGAPQGLVVVTGCAHAGLMNTMDFAAKTAGNAAVHAALGGFHLYEAGAKLIDRIGGTLRDHGVQFVLGSHCTGVERLFALRNRRTGFDARSAAVDSVGTVFEPGRGIIPVHMNRPLSDTP